MTVLEKKIDTCLRWIVAEEQHERDKIATEAISLLQQNMETTNAFAVEDCVVDLLRELGTSQGILGFNYLVSAIMLVMENNEYLNYITGKLYPDVADRFGTKPNRVERAVRHAIEKAFDNGDPEAHIKLFGGGISRFSGKATNSEFIAACAREVQRRMRNRGQTWND